MGLERADQVGRILPDAAHRVGGQQQMPAAPHSALAVISLGPALSARSSISQRARSATPRSEEHTSELQSLMRISYAVFCLKKKQRAIDCIVKHNTFNKLITKH